MKEKFLFMFLTAIIFLQNALVSANRFYDTDDMYSSDGDGGGGIILIILFCLFFWDIAKFYIFFIGSIFIITKLGFVEWLCIIAVIYFMHRYLFSKDEKNLQNKSQNNSKYNYEKIKAELNFWEDENNYLPTFFHSAYWEYVELKSCQFIYNNEKEYCFSANFIGVMNNIPPKVIKNGTRKFRQKKDLVSLPEFYDEVKKCWVIIPRSREMLNNEGLANYINSQHAFEGKMFTVVYEKLFGFEYEEPDEDYFPNWNKINLPFWRGDKNFPVGYYHAGYFEFVDLKNCKIVNNNGNEYTILVSFFSAAQFRKGIIRKSFRTFKFKKYTSNLPQIYNSEKHIWETLPKPNSVDVDKITILKNISGKLCQSPIQLMQAK